MIKNYQVNQEGIQDAGDSDGNLVVVEESKSERENTENTFIKNYGLPEDLFDFTDMEAVAPRVERIKNDQLGETYILVLSNARNPGSEDTTVEDRLEALNIILSEEKLFIFAYEGSEVFNQLTEKHGSEVTSLESIVLFIARDNYFNFIKELKKQKQRIDNLNDRALDASTDKSLLEQMTNTERSLVLLERTIDNQSRAINKLIEEKEFNDDALIYDVQWVDRTAKELSQVTRDLLDTLSGHFTTLMSRNLNSTMKFLNSVSLVLSVASLIFSLWGLNTGVPWESELSGFWFVVIIGAILSFAVGLYLRKKEY